MDDPEQRAHLLARIDAAEARLRHLVTASTPGLTDPDQATGERWEAGQVWAHVAEFVGYWLAELERVVAGARVAAGSAPIPYGRTRTDPGRIAAIERDRHEDPRALLRRTTDGIALVRSFLAELPPDSWQAVGLHPTRGRQTVATIVEHSLVSHLEEHADQLEGLAHQGASPSSPRSPAG
jgi:hypothetical protein